MIFWPVRCLGVEDGVLQQQRGRRHHGVHAAFHEGDQHLGDALAGLQLLDEPVLGQAGVRIAQEPVGADEQARQAHAADQGTGEVLGHGVTSQKNGQLGLHEWINH